MTERSQRFRRVADGLTRTIAAAPDGGWSNPSPCEDWTARDVLAHLVGWIPGPGFLLGTFDVATRPIPSVDDDPAEAWAAVCDAVGHALEDPDVAQRVEDCGPPGRMSFEQAVDMTCTPDVLIHTWDLATALGVPVELDGAELDRQLVGIDAMPPGVDEMMRSSGHFGPRVEVADDADVLTRVLAFNGRRADGSRASGAAGPGTGAA